MRETAKAERSHSELSIASFAFAQGHKERLPALLGVIPECMYVSLCVYTRACVYIWTCVYTRVYVHTHPTSLGFTDLVRDHS